MRRNRSYFDPTTELATLGIDRPAGVDDALGALAELTAIASQTPRLDLDLKPGQVAQAVEEAVLTRAARDYAREQRAWFETQMHKRIRAAYLENAGHIIEQLAALASKHLTTVTTAAKHLSPDDTAETVVDRGGEALKLWRKREDIDIAAAHLDRIADVSDMLARATGLIPSNAYSFAWVWFTKVNTHDKATELQHIFETARGIGGSLLAAAHAGHELTFATPEDVAARSSAILTDRDKPALAARQAAEAQEVAANRDIGQRWVDAFERATA